MNDAINEYRHNMKELETKQEVFFTGPYQCFCKAEKENKH